MRHLIMIVVAASIPAGQALAAKDAPQPRPQAFEDLVKCRSIVEETARLGCYDRAAAALDQAAQQRDIVVVDRNQVRQTKRSLFGLDIPNLNIFGGEGKDAEEEEIKFIEGIVESAVQDGRGRWIVTLQEGGAWAQTDDSLLALRPRPGHKVRIKRAALGSYMMSVNGQPSIRAKRQL